MCDISNKRAFISLSYDMDCILKGNGAVINLTFRFLSKLSGVKFGLYKSQISNTNHRSSVKLLNYSYFIVWVFLIKYTVLMAMEMVFQFQILALKILSKIVINNS